MEVLRGLALPLEGFRSVAFCRCAVLATSTVPAAGRCHLVVAGAGSAAWPAAAMAAQRWAAGHLSGVLLGWPFGGKGPFLYRPAAACR